MGLKDRKFILNGGMNLPHFDGGLEAGKTQPGADVPEDIAKASGKLDTFGKVMGGALAAMGAVLMMAQFKDASQTSLTPEQMMRSGSTGSVDGEQFLRITVDSDAAMKQEEAARTTNTIGMATTGMSTGAALGSFAGPVGGAIGAVVGGAAGLIGGIFAGNRRKRLAEEAKRKAILQAANTNEKRFDIAYTNALRKQQAQKYGDDDSQELYHGWIGLEPLKNNYFAQAKSNKYKDPPVNPLTGETYKKYKVLTTSGEKFETANASGATGELMWEKGTPNTHVIKNGPHDNAKLHIDKEKTVIFPESIINMFTGNPLAEDARKAKTTDELWLTLAQQIMTKEQLNLYKNVSNDRLLHSKDGWDTVGKTLTGLGEVLPTALNVFLGIKQIQASKDDIATPKSYVAPNTSKYQNDLDSLDINMYPIYQANRDASSISNTKIAQSGGLSAGQQMLGYLTNAMNERDADAKALTQAQMQRNAYKAEAAKVGINTELQRASLQLAANQWDYQQEAAAHNAKILNEQMGWYNISNAVQNFFKNRWEKELFDKMYNLYYYDATGKWPESKTKNKPFTPEELKKAVQDALKIPQTKTPFSPTNVPDVKVPEAAPDVKPQYNVSPGWDKWSQLAPEPFEPSKEYRPKLVDGMEQVYIDRKPFKIGSSGDDVKLIQQKLGINDDGKYGKTTRQKVIEWQRKHGLKRDGVVGEKTWKSLVGTLWSGVLSVPYEDRNHPYAVYYAPGYPSGIAYTLVTPHK